LIEKLASNCQPNLFLDLRTKIKKQPSASVNPDMNQGSISCVSLLAVDSTEKNRL